MNKPIDFSQPFEEVFGGGSFFESGLYRVERSGFGYFDFGKKGNDALCLIMDIQPVDEKGKDHGEMVTRYFAVGGKAQDGTVYVEPVDAVKGQKGLWRSIRFTDADTRGKLTKTSEFAVLVEHCHKNQIDMDAIQNDFTSFTGNTYEFGTLEMQKTARQKSAVEEAEDGEDSGGKKKSQRDTKTYIIIVSQPKAAKKSSKPKDEDEDESPKSKAKSKPVDEDEDEAPKKKGGKSKSEGPDDIVSEYLSTVVKKEVKKSGSADRNSHKLAFAKWLSNDKGVDADDKKAIMKVYNDDEQLGAVLETVGLKLNDDDEFVAADE